MSLISIISVLTRIQQCKRFAPEHPIWSALVGIKRGGSHLFLRYALEAGG